MKIIIVEDELLARERISDLIKQYDKNIEVIAEMDSIEETVSFFKSQPEVDLCFFDIQLADGLSFEIFKRVRLEHPVIFTTAYDQYSLKAFKVNSIDYLLKPINYDELAAAINKFKTLEGKKKSPLVIDQELAQKIILNFHKNFKKRFLVKYGEQIQFKETKDVAYFFADGKLAYLVSSENNRKYLIDNTLEELETLLDPDDFFRINRKYILNIDSIKLVKTFLNSRLIVFLDMEHSPDLIVSREKVSSFKEWLNK